ncbi:hypothetical protein BDF19DRAFT_261421 [Syncephalis fuscata]|nr:hypothetical protein BDF19DRAFT_261421 [Syncephalis fuscata]
MISATRFIFTHLHKSTENIWTGPSILFFPLLPCQLLRFITLGFAHLTSLKHPCLRSCYASFLSNLTAATLLNMSGYSIPIGFPFDGGIGQSGSSSPPGPPPGPPPPLPTGTLSLFAMDMDTPTEQGQLLTTSGSRQERVSLPFSNAESMSLLNPTSMNGQNQHYDSGGGGMSTASAGALLSDFEQQAFSEFLNRISSTDDFSMLMDSSWFSNGPFASLNSATTTPPTTNSNDNINNSLDLKAISIGSSAMPSTPNDMPTSMHPLTYSVTSAELAQLNLPISSALTTKPVPTRLILD